MDLQIIDTIISVPCTAHITDKDDISAYVFSVDSPHQTSALCAKEISSHSGASLDSEKFISVLSVVADEVPSKPTRIIALVHKIGLNAEPIHCMSKETLDSITDDNNLDPETIEHVDTLYTEYSTAVHIFEILEK